MNDSSDWYERIFHPAREDSPKQKRLKEQQAKLKAQYQKLGQRQRELDTKHRQQVLTHLGKIMRLAGRDNTFDPTILEGIVQSHLGATLQRKCREFSDTQKGRRFSQQRRVLKAKCQSVKTLADRILKDSWLQHKTHGTLSKPDLLAMLKSSGDPAASAYILAQQEHHDLEKRIAELSREMSTARYNWLKEQHLAIGKGIETATKGGSLKAETLRSLFQKYASDSEQQLLLRYLFGPVES